MAIKYKKCGGKYGCGETKSEHNFHKRMKRGKLVLAPNCIICERVKARAYRKKHKNLYNEATRRWRENNQEHVKKYSLEYERKNKEKRYAKNAKWIKEHPEKNRERARRRRVMVASVKENFNYDDEKFVMKKFEYMCFNCKSKNNLHIDHHYPLSSGNPLVVENAVVLCVSCNCSKGAKDPSDFYTDEQILCLAEKYGVGV